MKNIYKIGKELFITSNEEIKLNDYITDGYNVWKWEDDSSLLGRKKVIITTDHDLIADGVQKVDDEFLNWLIDNPNCEYVKVTKLDYLTNRQHRIYDLPQEEPKQDTCVYCNNKGYITNHSGTSKIDCIHCNIPKQEPKQENCNHYFVTKFGESECQEFGTPESEVINSNYKRMYSEEEVLFHLNKLMRMPSSELDKLTDENGEITRKWFNNNKKK